MRLPTSRPHAVPTPHARPRTAQGLLGATLLSLTLIACSQAEPPPVESAALAGSPLDFDVAALIRVMIAPAGPDEAADFLARMPAATAQDATPVRNRHQPRQVDQVVTRHYPGVAVEVYQVTRPAQALPQSVRVDRPDVEFRGLRVGMPYEEARSALSDAKPADYGGPGEAFLVVDDVSAPALYVLERSSGALGAYTVHAYLD